MDQPLHPPTWHLLNARLVRRDEPIAQPSVVVAVRCAVEHVLTSVTNRRVPADLVLRPPETDSHQRVVSGGIRVNRLQGGRSLPFVHV